MNNLENKHRKQRIELANNLTLAAVTVTAIVNTIAVILKIAIVPVKAPRRQLQK